MHFSSSALPARPPLGRPRCNPKSDFGIYAVDVSTGQTGEDQPRWLVLDGHGRVVARAHSELLAIAKMQVLLLTELTSPSRTEAAAKPSADLAAP
jgi:hypothetical protein